MKIVTIHSKRKKQKLSYIYKAKVFYMKHHLSLYVWILYKNKQNVWKNVNFPDCSILLIVLWSI